MASKRVLGWMASSVWLWLGAFNFVFWGAILGGLYAATGDWLGLTPLLVIVLPFMAAAALELWLSTDSAKAITAPVAARMEPIGARIDESRISRWFEKVIANSMTASVIAYFLISAVLMAVVLAAISFMFTGRAIDGVLDNWGFFAAVAGYGVLWLVFYYAGLDPDQAFKKLFFAAAIGVIGFEARPIWTTFTHSEWNSQYQRDARRDFHKAIMGTPTPCVTSRDNLSDLSACTVFGLRPGMTQSEALDIVNNSGYFQSKDKPAVCKTDERCSHYVSFLIDGLYLRVEFNTDAKTAASDERVSSVVLSLSEGANPYFDENQMLAAFLKLIGPNGISINDTNIVLTDIKNALELRAYTSAWAFWAVFSSRLADHPGQPGVPV